jgi:hypothetical protein
MRYSDVAQFEVPKDLAKRLGYKTVYVSGKDLLVVHTPQGRDIPQIVANSDPGVLISGLKDANVLGVIFEGEELTKKVVEKASEFKKIIFIPVGRLTRAGIEERGPKIGRLRRIIFSAHKLGARVCFVTLASSEIELLSTEQMKEVGRLLLRGGNGAGLLSEDLL